MHGQQAAVQDKKNIFALAIGGANAAALGMPGEMRSGLRLCGDGVKDVNATDSPALDEGTEGAYDSFHFREFRHGRGTESRARLESERVLPRVCLGSIAERRENRFAFIPIGKLIGVMAAARLAGLSRGNQQNGFIPVSRVADKAHGGAVSIGSGANAVASARLGFVRNAEKFPQQALPPDVVIHLQGIEAFPRPILNAVALGLLSQGGDSLVGGSDQQLVVVLVARWQPLRWPI